MLCHPRLLLVCCLIVAVSAQLAQAQQQKSGNQGLLSNPKLAFKHLGNNPVSVFKSMFHLQQRKRTGIQAKSGRQGGLDPRPKRNHRLRPRQNNKEFRGGNRVNRFRFGRGTPPPQQPPPSPPQPQQPQQHPPPPPPPPPQPSEAPQPLPLEPNSYSPGSQAESEPAPSPSTTEEPVFYYKPLDNAPPAPPVEPEKTLYREQSKYTDPKENESAEEQEEQEEPEEGTYPGFTSFGSYFGNSPFYPSEAANPPVSNNDDLVYYTTVLAPQPTTVSYSTTTTTTTTSAASSTTSSTTTTSSYALLSTLEPDSLRNPFLYETPKQTAAGAAPPIEVPYNSHPLEMMAYYPMRLPPPSSSPKEEPEATSSEENGFPQYKIAPSLQTFYSPSSSSSEGQSVPENDDDDLYQWRPLKGTNEPPGKIYHRTTNSDTAPTTTTTTTAAPPPPESPSSRNPYGKEAVPEVPVEPPQSFDSYGIVYPSFPKEGPPEPISDTQPPALYPYQSDSQNGVQYPKQEETSTSAPTPSEVYYKPVESSNEEADDPKLPPPGVVYYKPLKEEESTTTTTAAPPKSPYQDGPIYYFRPTQTQEKEKEEETMTQDAEVPKEAPAEEVEEEVDFYNLPPYNSPFTSPAEDEDDSGNGSEDAEAGFGFTNGDFKIPDFFRNFLSAPPSWIKVKW